MADFFYITSVFFQLKRPKVTKYVYQKDHSCQMRWKKSRQDYLFTTMQNAQLISINVILKQIFVLWNGPLSMTVLGLQLLGFYVLHMFMF